RASRRLPARHGATDRRHPARGGQRRAAGLGRSGAAQRRLAGPGWGGGTSPGALPPARRPRAATGQHGNRNRRRTRGMMNVKTYTARQGDIERTWFVVDATDQTLGRLATRVARVLEGKHKPTWSPNLDT